ncbi:MAG: class A beta-lactamase-related serine hydrolase [Bacteroidetes bacterium]|nr:MAG: class A beta-lactamase-related serine hydrolase [Bacteroidota bacterium]
MGHTGSLLIRLLYNFLTAMKPYFILFAFLLSLTYGLQAQQPPAHYLKAEKAVLEFLKAEGEASVQAFIDEAMKPAAVGDRQALLARLEALRRDFKPYLQDVGIEGNPEGLLFLFSDGQQQKNLFVALDQEGITELREQQPEPRLHITAENLAAVIDSLEERGMAGLVTVKKQGKALITRPFGMANAELGVPNSLNTIFGIGSRPIDFTVAAILLLDQQGKLSLDDPITRFFEAVPPDRQGMRIRHLMSGQSGLPDFFDTEADWDPDLAWVSRETAEQRLLHIPLLFEPGNEQQHSHAAFGLLAAIIERVSGMGYYAFIRKHFLDPAGMSRTGEYGEHRDLKLSDFAVGGGPEKVGLPNIPPNWGPTSWLVKGSGGMYSTLADLRSFYRYVRSGQVLDAQHARHFMGASVNLDGSMRGFELFSISHPARDTEVYFFVNNLVDRKGFRQLIRGLEAFVRGE